jgi:hypothetical protein
MSVPLQINNSFFFPWRGGIESSLYLCGDGGSDEQRQGYIDWSKAHGCDGIILCLHNEGIMSLWNEYGRSVNMAKFNTFMAYVRRLHGLGARITFALYDFPGDESGQYPCLRYMDRHAGVIRDVCTALNPYASAYLLGIETNRWREQPARKWWTRQYVLEGVQALKHYAGLIPVGSHEQWRPEVEGFVGGDFCCYEALAHPITQADGVTPEALCAEVRNIQKYLPPGFPVWVAEFNGNNSERAREQARALAELPGVVGVGGPLK